MKILKIMSSINPQDGRKVPAKIVEEKGKIYMIKKIDNKNRKILIEVDTRLYNLLQNKRERVDVNHLYLEPSTKCNLNCPVCFIHGQTENLSLKEIKKEISKYRNKIISISGGEPTLRNDLLKMIRIINKANIPNLATNGIKLANYRYVKKLEKAGLRYVTFSFNGFSDEVYIKMNGVPLLKQKLKAIENLKRTKIKFLLSVLLARGINEKEIRPIVEYAIKNIDSIREVRIRAMAQIGKYLKQKRFLPSEILNIICRELRIDKKDVYRELEIIRELIDRFNFPIFQKSCGFSFHLLVKNGKYVPIGRYLKSSNIFSIFKYVHLVYDFPSFLKKRMRKRRISLWYHRNSILKVSIRCWPTAETFNFYDHYKLCGSRYFVGKKKGLPVCYSNILEDIKLKNLSSCTLLHHNEY